jgi:uncharacterized membrane protein YfcA
VSGTVWALASAIVLVGALVHGSVGFGINLVAGPLLVILDPAFIPGPLILIAGLMVVLVLATERSSLDVSAVRRVSIGLVPGSVAGTLALQRLSPHGLEAVVGLGVLVVVLATALRPQIDRTPATLMGAGVLSGFAATTAALAGPPIALLYQREPPAVLRSTLSGVFVVGTPITVAALAAFGQFGAEDVRLALALVPSTLGGFVLSRVLAPVVDPRLSAATVLWVSAFGCVVVLARALV